LLFGSFTDASFSEVHANYVATEDVYSLKDKPEMIWKEELVVCGKYGTLLWQIFIKTNKNLKKKLSS
jgi:hypothetical protein